MQFYDAIYATTSCIYLSMYPVDSYNVHLAALLEASSDRRKTAIPISERNCSFLVDPGGVQLSLFIVAGFPKHMFTATVPHISQKFPQKGML